MANIRDEQGACVAAGPLKVQHNEDPETRHTHPFLLWVGHKVVVLRSDDVQDLIETITK